MRILNLETSILLLKPFQAVNTESKTGSEAQAESGKRWQAVSALCSQMLLSLDQSFQEDIFNIAPGIYERENIDLMFCNSVY